MAMPLGDKAGSNSTDIPPPQLHPEALVVSSLPTSPTFDSSSSNARDDMWEIGHDLKKRRSKKQQQHCGCFEDN
jgi:hypothetical protein